MPNPEKMIKKMRGRNKKLAGMSDNKAAVPKGPDVGQFGLDAIKAGGALVKAGSDTVQKKKARGMIAKLRKKHGIK